MNYRNILIAGACAALTASMLSGCGGAPNHLSQGGAITSSVVADTENTVLAHSVTTRPTAGAADDAATTTATAAGGTSTTTATRGGQSTDTPTDTPHTPVTPDAPDAPDDTPTTTTAAADEYVDGLKVVARIGGAPLCRFDDNLYKLDVPFENIYTAVFFLRLSSTEWAIVDTATTASDVDTYIVPAAAKLGISLSQIKGILLTHDHADHAGGLPRLFARCANATVYGVSASNSTAGSRYRSITDGASLFGGTVKMVTLRGHAVEACGYYDTRSKTVMTGDSIQFYGAGQYGCQVYGGLSHYEASMAKLKGMVENGEIENILISHKYVPVSAVSLGRENSIRYMTVAQQCYEDIKAYTIEKYNSGTRSADAIMRAFMSERGREYADFPTGSFSNVMGTIINTYCR